MDVKMERITPEKAQQYLNRNTCNRKLRDGVVEKYAADMKAGKWTECPVPISFYDNGDVADGQHRLWAIIESETPQKFLVARGLPREAGLNIDTGATRSVVDNARISGTDTDLSNEMLAVARAVQEGERQSRACSNATRLGFVEKHREAVKWAVTHGPRGRYIRNAVVLAAMARAWYYEADKERLAAFARVLTDGHVQEGEADSAAVALRNYFLTKSLNGRRIIRTMFRDSFLKTQNAIKYFMQRKKLMVIKSVAEEHYPLKKNGK